MGASCTIFPLLLYLIHAMPVINIEIQCRFAGRTYMTANRSSMYDCQPVNNNTAPLVSESQELVEVLQKIVRNTAALLEMQDCVIALQDARGTTWVTYTVPQKQEGNPLVERLQGNEGVA